MKFKFVIVGGGIAGVTCAETLSQLCDESGENEILLISASPLIKAVTNFRQISKNLLVQFDVEERPLSHLTSLCPNVVVRHASLTSLDSHCKKVHTSDGAIYSYEKLCICTGASPKVISKDNPYVLGIRDTESVKVFQDKLWKARRIVVVGNGGIATEIVYEIEGCEVVWAIKDDSINSTFIDPGAAEFLIPTLREDKKAQQGPLKRSKFTLEGETHNSELLSETMGGALGPDWHSNVNLKGPMQCSHQVCIETKVEVDRILTPEEFKNSGSVASEFPSSTGDFSESWPVYVKLTNRKVYGCDFVVSATGVVPNTKLLLGENQLQVSGDGGLSVDCNMKTSVPDVYAAGDVCTADWDHAPHWLQMRLWTQARQFGGYAAKCMISHINQEEISLDFCFELFTHVTKFFNYKVVLLGRFNAQGLGKDHELLLRVTKGHEYVKAVMKEGRMQGAILIGETDLEETFENLILNQLDLSRYGADLLNPNIDIEDYFD